MCQHFGKVFMISKNLFIRQFKKQKGDSESFTAKYRINVKMIN